MNRVILQGRATTIFKMLLLPGILKHATLWIIRIFISNPCIMCWIICQRSSLLKELVQKKTGQGYKNVLKSKLYGKKEL